MRTIYSCSPSGLVEAGFSVKVRLDFEPRQSQSDRFAPHGSQPRLQKTRFRLDAPTSSSSGILLSVRATGTDFTI